MAADRQSRARRKPIITPVPIGAPASELGSPERTAKPTPAGLGVERATLDWQRSGAGPGSFEIAFVAGRRDGESDQTAAALTVENRLDVVGPDAVGPDDDRADWVLLRVVGDPAGRVLVYDRNEWTCFLDGAEHGEFDWPEGLTPAAVV